MRILWVKMGGLWPPTAGGRIRSLETLSCLSRHHDVTVVTTHGPGDDPDGLRRRLPNCSRIVSVPFAAPRAGTLGVRAGAGAASWCTPHPVDLWKWRVGRRVRRGPHAADAAGDVDVCVADFLVAVANIPRAPRVPVVLFEHNVEHMIWRRVAGLERRPWRARAARDRGAEGARRPNGARARAADLVVAVSDDDRRAAAGAGAGAAAAWRLPPAWTPTYFSRPRGREMPNRLVFTGSMDWFPNEDAILFFIDAILPRIRAEVPGVTLSVVGRNPVARALRAAAERAGVVVTGTVDDVRPYVDEAAVYVVPLRAGGGTRLKIFEALAMGKAVVSTTRRRRRAGGDTGTRRRDRGSAGRVCAHRDGAAARSCATAGARTRRPAARATPVFVGAGLARIRPLLRVCCADPPREKRHAACSGYEAELVMKVASCHSHDRARR